jgi:cell division septation protein DedD
MLVAPEQQAALPGQSQLAPGTEEPNPRALVSRQEPRREAGAVPPPHAKTFVVQLMATKTEAAAQTVWDQLTAKMPALLSGHHPLFLKTNEPGPTPWRLRTGGFTDQAQAKTFCDHLKGKGLTCVVSES